MFGGEGSVSAVTVHFFSVVSGEGCTVSAQTNSGIYSSGNVAGPTVRVMG